MQNHEKSAFRLARSDGFTFLELMIVLIVAIILVGVGVPAFKDGMAKKRIDSARRGLSDTLLLAREESRDAKEPVTICASSDGKTCDTEDWAEGLIVFRDPNNQGTVDAGEAIIVVTEKAGVGIAIDSLKSTDGSEFSRGYIVFNQGETDQTGELKFITCKSSHLPYNLTLGRNGRISSSPGTQVCS